MDELVDVTVHNINTNDVVLSQQQIRRVLMLLEDGCTVPFIVRYRSDVTNDMHADAVRTIQHTSVRAKEIISRRSSIMKTLTSKGELTEQLKRAIMSSYSIQALSDLYAPFKTSSDARSFASRARHNGYSVLADEILEKKHSFINWSKCRGEKSTAYESIVHLLAEAMAASPEVISSARNSFNRTAILESKTRKFIENKIGSSKRKKNSSVRKTSTNATYETYSDFSAPLNRLRPHQILALARGEVEKIVTIKLRIPSEVDRYIISIMKRSILYPKAGGEIREMVSHAAADGYKRLVKKRMKSELRRCATERAIEAAICTFSANLRKLLLTAPLRGENVLAIDPGYRHGCKVAVVNASGSVLATDVIYPHMPHNNTVASINTLSTLVHQHRVKYIAVGNGKACRETESLVATFIRDGSLDVRYCIVNEDGASVYSVSPTAISEMPDIDAAGRGSVSLARRLQDPLAELVKMPPKSLGVGMYQHDVPEKRLELALAVVIEDCVSEVGVNINTASVELLQYVPGLGKKRAKSVREYVIKNGPLMSREGLLNIKGFGQKTYEQCAGFLVVHNGTEPLDVTRVHPTDYELARRIKKLFNNRGSLSPSDRAVIVSEWGIKEGRMRQIVNALNVPLGVDPRDSMTRPLFRQDVLSLDDILIGSYLVGRITNVADFGAFVDCGVGIDGLLHESQYSEPLSLGHVVDVCVVSLDLEKRRLSLVLNNHNNETSGITNHHTSTRYEKPAVPGQGKKRRICDAHDKRKERKIS